MWIIRNLIQSLEVPDGISIRASAMLILELHLHRRLQMCQGEIGGQLTIDKIGPMFTWMLEMAGCIESRYNSAAIRDMFLKVMRGRSIDYPNGPKPGRSRTLYCNGFRERPVPMAATRQELDMCVRGRATKSRSVQRCVQDKGSGF